MAKFCKKCGTMLDETSGKCPVCDKTEIAEKQTEIKETPVKEPEPQKQLSKKELRAEKKKLKKQAKKDRKKQKRAQLTTKQKVSRFFIKFLAVILALIIAVSGCTCALVYFDMIDFPFVSDIMEKLGIAREIPNEDGFNSITEDFTDILVTDEQSAIEAAKEAAEQMGLGNAADELTVDNVSTVGDLTYYRLQQNYQGIPVYGKTITVVVDKEGNAISLTSNVSNIDKISIDIDLSSYNFTSAVENYLKNERNINSLQNVTVRQPSEKDLIIYDMNGDTGVVIACEIKVDFLYEYGNATMILLFDLSNSNVISQEQTINSDSAICYGPTKNDGSFTGIKNNNIYVMKDVERNIYILNAEDNTYYDPYLGTLASGVPQLVTSTDEFFGNDDDNGNNYDRAFNLLKYVSNVYDFYRKNYNDDGIGILVAIYDDHVGAYNGGNAGGGIVPLNTSINVALPEYQDPNSNNPELAGQVGLVTMGTTYSSNLVQSLDIIAHEYTHFISRCIVGWTGAPAGFKDETGAINEGYSDIFGEIIEANINNSAPNWEHGRRIIRDPSQNGYPEYVDDSLRADTDYSHGYSTVVSYSAYLMSNGINNQHTSLSIKEIADLWYKTLHTLPSNCTFAMLRDCMEMTAENIGFTEEQMQCVSAAFDEVGIESQDGEEKYSTDATLSVKDRNGDAYDDYTIKITGKKYRGIFKTGLWKEEYSNEITVSDTDPVSLNLTRGDYTITVTDNFDSSNSTSKPVKIRGGSKNKELVMATSFGFDYVINTSAQLSVFDMNNLPYDNYTVKIDGTYTDSNNTKQSYSDILTATTGDPINIALNEGKYSFLLKDGLDENKTKSFTVRVRPVGLSAIKVYTAFGKKSGQFDKADVPQNAAEFNGHYYYIYTDERSWSDADVFCKSQNGYLATITSAEEQNFVQQYMQAIKKSLSSEESGNWDKELWIGANDQNFEGDWEWSNGESFSYANWGTNEPDDAGGQDYAALLTFLSEGSGYRINEGQWDDTSSHRCPFICEWGEYTPESAEKEEASKPERETSDERDIVLVLDISGSMSGTPLAETKKAATKFISTILKEDASIGIVVYDDNAQVLSDFSKDEEKLTGIVSGISDRGSTNIDDGLTKANELLQYSNAEKKIIVLMSDGMPNRGREGDDLIAFADSIKETGTYIYTLGFFESVGGSKSSAQLLMEGIASDGCHYEVADADDLVFFFGDIADQINGQKFIYVRIACPVDVTVTYLGESLSSSEKDFNDRTSFGALSLEDIEGSDDKIKTLRLKEGTDYDIKIEGTGRGKMDYTIGYMDDKGEYSDMRNFRNINITRSTVIDTSTKYSGKTVLNVDEDGDGRYDLKFRAGANEFGELVDYTYVIYIVTGVVAAIAVLTVIIIIRKKVKKKKEI